MHRLKRVVLSDRAARKYRLDQIKDRGQSRISKPLKSISKTSAVVGDTKSNQKCSLKPQSLQHIGTSNQDQANGSRYLGHGLGLVKKDHVIVRPAL